MKPRIKFATIYAVTILILYWIGVYLSGVEITRGKIIVWNYGISLAIAAFVAAGTIAYPGWREDE